MKRLFIFVVVGLLLGGTALFADESVLIDFTKLGADQTVGTNKTPTENAATMIDYSGVAGASFSDEEKAAMKSSLALGNWQVTLASSARSIANQSVTMTKEATTNAERQAVQRRGHGQQEGPRDPHPFPHRAVQLLGDDPAPVRHPRLRGQGRPAGRPSSSSRTRTRARERSSTATAS